MNAQPCHYLLFSEARSVQNGASSSQRGCWRFVLETIDGSERFEAADEEPFAGGQRLELLAVVRGLEALDQPSRVTLVTASSYVSRGIRFGITEWRENDWMWERFGKMTPVKDGDLWRRVDQALRYHQVECRTWRYEPPQVAEGVVLQALPAADVERAPRSRPTASKQAAWVVAAAQAAWESFVQTWQGALVGALRRIAPPLTTSGNVR